MSVSTGDVSELLITSGSDCNDESVVPSSKRKRQVNSKLKGYVTEKKPAGTCPGCNTYVESDAVVCDTCNAYWHYVCANTSAEEVEMLGNEEIYCEKHRIPVITAGQASYEGKKHESNHPVKENLLKSGWKNLQ